MLRSRYRARRFTKCVLSAARRVDNWSCLTALRQFSSIARLFPALWLRHRHRATPNTAAFGTRKPCLISNHPWKSRLVLAQTSKEKLLKTSTLRDVVWEKSSSSRSLAAVELRSSRRSRNRTLSVARSWSKQACRKAPLRLSLDVRSFRQMCEKIGLERDGSERTGRGWQLAFRREFSVMSIANEQQAGANSRTERGTVCMRCIAARKCKLVYHRLFVFCRRNYNPPGMTR